MNTWNSPEEMLRMLPLVIFAMAMMWDNWRLRKRNNTQSESICRLLSQVKTLQAHPDSWQSGYDAGRKMGSKTEVAKAYQLDRVYKGAEEDRARLDSGMIIITGRDEFGETTRTHARGLNLRQLIDEAIEEHKL
jgi:hypothetical protein